MNHLMVPLFLTTLFAVGCGEKSDATDTASGTDEALEDVDAASVYTAYCSGCHASDGTGASGPALTESVPNLSDADLMDILQDGIGSMAAPSLTEPEEDALFLYLRERFGEYGGAR